MTDTNIRRDKPLIAVWFSCGAASAVAAKKTIEKYGASCHIRILNNPVKEEHLDNIRFKDDVQKWLGIEIETVFNPSYPNCSAEEIWDERSFMSGPHGAPCTTLLKQEARKKWEIINSPDYHVLGYTADERDRYTDFLKKRPNTIGVLLDAGITKGECFRIVQEAGLKLPDMYLLGYPNANCPGCVKASSPTYWNHVRKVHPEVFTARALQSREIGAKLVRYKGKRIFLDELPVDAIGMPMKDMNFECGIFCSRGSNEIS